MGEVLEGAQVTDVVGRYGVAGQTVYDWLRRYSDHGLGGLADRSSRPDQMSTEIEARAVELPLAPPGLAGGHHRLRAGQPQPDARPRAQFRVVTKP